MLETMTSLPMTENEEEEEEEEAERDLNFVERNGANFLG
jgi:hypothetical protein